MKPRPVLDYVRTPPKPELSPRVAGRELRCKHCDHTAFVVTRGRPASELCVALGVSPEAVGDSADVYVCCNCGRVEVYFSIREDVRAAAERYPPSECPRCNMIVRSDHERCGNCGWTRPTLADK